MKMKKLNRERGGRINVLRSNRDIGESFPLWLAECGLFLGFEE